MSPHNDPTRAPRSRLVIADDSAEMRAVVRSAIGDDFDEVVEVADGRALFWEMLRMTFHGEPGGGDVIVTDQYMPAYNGLDVIDGSKEIRSNVPMVLITAFPDELVRYRAEKLGAVLLAKPFSTTALRRVIQQVRHDRNH